MEYRAHKFRIYPNKEQRIFLNKQLGASRTFYNIMLGHRKELVEKYYDKDAKTWTDLDKKDEASKYGIDKWFRAWSRENISWIKEIDSLIPSYVSADLDDAFQGFFTGKGYPKFKSKYDHNDSYHTRGQNKGWVKIENHKLKLPKCKTWIKVKDHTPINFPIDETVISRTPSGKYYVTIREKFTPEELPKTGKAVGIDLGIHDLVITSDGEKYSNPKYLSKSEKKIKKRQKQLNRKQEGSSNYEKTRVKLAKAHEHIANQRKYNLNNISNQLVNEYDFIASESLRVTNMLKNHKLAKSISDSSWGEFTRQLEYKSNWSGKEYVKIDTFFASSQICHKCGYKNEEIKDLSIRKWTCPVCGEYHDRDVNAANNILTKGLEIRCNTN